jgi:polygalacturonase
LTLALPEEKHSGMNTPVAPADPSNQPKAVSDPGRRRALKGLLGIGGIAVAAGACAYAAEPPASGGRVSVRDYGAAGDGSKLDTRALQAAIDACAGGGGGTVYLPPGRYLSGTLFLKSHVTLHLEGGATLLGSTKLEDYPPTIPAIRSYTDNYTERSLIYAENLEHVAFEGHGTIDGQGGAFKGPYKVRPYLLRVIACREVSMRGLTLRNSPMWVQHYLACEGVCIDGIRVESTCNANNDGIDIDGCERVRIANCDIRSGDDALVLKSTQERFCRNVVVTNCVLSSLCNAFKLGTESNGGFENIVMSNCAIYDTRISGLALELVDGGTLEQVSISNVTMHNTRSAIFIRLGDRARPFRSGMEPIGTGRLRHVRISDVQAFGADAVGCSITGLPGHPVEDVALENVTVSFAGGGKLKDLASVPEKEKAYPEYGMFDALPSYGFLCRHARGLRLSRVQVSTVQPDPRPALVCEDVSGLDLFGWRAGANDSPTVVFQEVQDALVHGCQAAPGTGVWLRVGGNNSAAIRLVANELSAARQAVERGQDVPAQAVMVKP